ncbi:MAG: argininosuccinate synthase [Candidatus Micrarchaeota archaeon]|nr:argininosuccinate synthase [Candidatus Micrarchaeota archaeon]
MEPIIRRAKMLAQEHPSVSKVALAYSGGLDSAVIGKLLLEAGFEVLPVVINLGQQSDLGRVEKNAKAIFGQCRLYDARENFVMNVGRGIKASCRALGGVNAGGLSRPSMAYALAQVARESGCQAIAHGASGMGNDHLTMENSLRVLAPEMRIIAPVRDLDLRRDEALSFAAEKKLPTNLKRALSFSADENLWCRTLRQGAALEISAPLPEEAYKWTVSPQKAPEKGAEVEVEFLNGLPVRAKIGGKEEKGLLSIIEALNEVGGKHGIGRLDFVTDRVVGLKVHEAYECPAALILLAAHEELEALVLTTRELEAKHYIDALWNRLVYDGGWYTRLRRALDAFIDETQRAVDGSVELSLYKGSIRVKGRKSRHALYDARLSSRDSSGVFTQKESRSFAKLYCLQDVIAYMMELD